MQTIHSASDQKKCLTKKSTNGLGVWGLRGVVLGVLLLGACSDPVEEARKAHLVVQADSLRAKIQATRNRIDSLRLQSESLMHWVDSLDMSPP